MVTLEIAANDYNLNIPRYVEPKVDQEVLTVEEAMQCLQASATPAFAAEDKLSALLKPKDTMNTASTASPRAALSLPGQTVPTRRLLL